VWTLLQRCYALHGVKPTLLERDFNLPTTAELMLEMEQIHDYQAAALRCHAQNSAHAIQRSA
ncbi:MAG: multinuclear nonheme iron-dependent oxidase, partial [Shewanella sp.]